ncbi:flocculation protein FLO11 isoform X1 [Pararge aegeria]|uniref:flocculation protein FLO11 isoform X1 n=1 Tax=Pararge aegeria TaxID=116150 RepID=UPI0019D0D05B|nr:flocculation protein FLO11 isoform X1 [Pararge aegeria]
MVIGNTTVSKGRGAGRTAKSTRNNLIVIDAPLELSGKTYRPRSSSIEPDDVIDLGAPGRYRDRFKRRTAGHRTSPPPRLPALYTPNPRLYPGPAAANKKERKTRLSKGHHKRHGRGQKFTKPVPNSRLYRPTPPRTSPPLLQPRGNWPAPEPTKGSLDTASKAALRLLQQRHLRPPSLSPLRNLPLPIRTPSVTNAVKARRLVVTLPAAESGDAPRYQPASEHFRHRVRPSLGSGASTPPAVRRRHASPAGRAGVMAATNKNSTSPDCSDGNDASSAPSEFLAEFLSAIMRHQYAEALKYCQLILQYEPHNSTARGFYPLLQHKVNAHANTHRKAQKKEETSSESEETSPRSRRGALSDAHGQQKTADVDVETEGSPDGSDSGEEEMEQGADGSGSACSSLELDSEPSPATPSPRTPHTPHTPRRSDRADTTDPNDTTDPTDPSDSASWRWESGGERSERDDNGNHPAQPHNHTNNQGGVDDKDVENDNAMLPSNSHLKSDSLSSLQRLRAQFTCSIK